MPIFADAHTLQQLFSAPCSCATSADRASARASVLASSCSKTSVSLAEPCNEFKTPKCDDECPTKLIQCIKLVRRAGMDWGLCKKAPAESDRGEVLTHWQSWEPAMLADPMADETLGLYAQECRAHLCWFCIFYHFAPSRQPRRTFPCLTEIPEPQYMWVCPTGIQSLNV